MVNKNDLMNKLVDAIYEDNYDKVQQILKKAKKNNKILMISSIHMMLPIKNNNVKIVKLLMDYANENNYTFDINIEKSNKESPLLFVCQNDNMEMLTLLFEYASQNNIILKFNKEAKNNILDIVDEEKNNILKIVDEKKNIEMLLLLLEYAKEKHVDLNVYVCDSLIRNAINDNNIVIIKSVIDYFVETNNWYIGKKTIISAIKSKKANILKLLLDYLKKEKEVIYCLYCDWFDCLSEANEVEMVKLFIDYMNDKNKILDINKTYNEGNYLLLIAIRKNNFEIVKFLFDYASEHHIIMDINKKNKYGDYPVQLAAENNNIEIIKFLKNYAYEHKILLKYDMFDLSYEIYNLLNEKSPDEKEDEKEKLKKIIEQEVRESIEGEVRESIEREVRVSIEREVKERIEREVRERIEREIRESIERELREKLKREVKEMIIQEQRAIFQQTIGMM